MITEKIEIPLENLRAIAVENAKDAATSVEVVEEEYRNVNGKKVLMLRMTGIIQGIKFVYFGYYYSYEGGTIQLLTYTSQNLFKEYKSRAEDFLNGFVDLNVSQ